MGHIIAVSNNKGGVGKTTIAANLAHSLANKGRRVLLVDSDSQCNLSSFFSPPDIPAERTLFGLLESGGHPDPAAFVHLAREYERISILPNKPETAALEPELTRRQDLGWFVLRDTIREYAKREFDFTILDTPPNLGLFSLQAIICADGVLVPVEAASKFSLDGLTKTLATIEDIASVPGVGDSGRFLRLIINRADRRTAVTKISIEYMQATYGDRVCRTIIPAATHVQQAEQMGATVLRHMPRCQASSTFRALGVEIMSLPI